VVIGTGTVRRHALIASLSETIKLRHKSHEGKGLAAEEIVPCARDLVDRDRSVSTSIINRANTRLQLWRSTEQADILRKRAIGGGMWSGHASS